MDAVLLTTKLFMPPPRPGVILRSRLLERLDAGLDCPLTLISAPAGFGKTTLLSGWIASWRAGPAVAWLSLDEGDNDLARFLAYFIAAPKPAPRRWRCCNLPSGRRSSRCGCRC